MHLSQIDLNLFTVFDAIYREGGITAASKYLHLSQPAVSHALARLREMLNDPLFERHGNDMVPTPRARALASTISQALGGLEGMLQRNAQFEPAESRRRFVVAMREAHEITFLPEMLDALTRDAPGIDLATVRIERRDLEEDLQCGDLDIAIDMALPVSVDIHRQRVHAEPMVVLARKDHPSLYDKLDLPTYLAMEHVLVTGRRRGLGYEDSILQRLNVTRRIRIRCRQHAAANEVVSRTNLLATMPRRYAEHVNRHVGNKVFAFPAEIPLMELFMYWHANIEDDPAHRWFRELTLRFI